MDWKEPSAEAQETAARGSQRSRPWGQAPDPLKDAVP